MQDEPADLPPELIANVLCERWALAVREVRYAPVGFGSCHWIGDDNDGPRWFVTANHLEPSDHWTLTTADEIFAVLQSAAETTAALAKSGLDFVIAGLPTTSGTQVERVGDDWAIEVFPYVDGRSTANGEWTDASERRTIARILANLHTAPPPPATPRWDLVVPHRRHLIHALNDAGHTWTSGLYAERLGELLVTYAPHIHEALARYDRLVEAVRATEDAWVVTHGEPHSANVIRATNGEMRLIDWDTVRLAPRERDLRDILTDDDGEALAEYQRIAGPVRLNPDALALRETWWTLAEISEYVRRFRQPHSGSADDATAWEGLGHELSTLA